jgi:hypothetical protein
MQKYTEIYSFKISKEQKETLLKLEKYNIKISAFIRIAISEKIKRDYKKIKSKKVNYFCPF